MIRQADVIGGRGLQFEIKRAAETLAQRESPSLVDAAAKRRVNHELHSATFIEKAFGDNGFLRRDRAQHGSTLDHVFHGNAEKILGLEPLKGGA